MEKDFLVKFADLKEDEVLEWVRKDVEKGKDPQEILRACQEAMRIVGERFQDDIYFVSDLMMSGVIFKEVGEILKPSDLLATGTPDDVYRYVRELIKDIGGKGLLLCPGCDAPVNAKHENMMAMYEAGKEFGRVTEP